MPLLDNIWKKKKKDLNIMLQKGTKYKKEKSLHSEKIIMTTIEIGFER